MPDQNRSLLRDTVFWEAIAWLTLAGLAFWFSRPFDKPLQHFAPGAAYWPKIIIAGMFIAALILLIGRLSAKNRSAPEETVAHLEEVPDDLPGMNWRLIAMFVMPLIWVYGMHQMGFLLVTPLFLIAFTWLMGVTKITTLLTYSLGFYAMLVLVFYKLIFTPLPMGSGYFHTINGELLALMQ